MSTIQEIESAIRKLAPADRDQLVRDLPEILPELNGDAAWERLTNDPRSRPALTALLDRVDVTIKGNPDAFSEIKESDFDR
jgi:hypothetical protein